MTKVHIYIIKQREQMHYKTERTNALSQIKHGVAPRLQCFEYGCNHRMIIQYSQNIINMYSLLLLEWKENMPKFLLGILTKDLT